MFIRSQETVLMGDRVRLIKDVQTSLGTFTKGHEFTVQGLRCRWGYLLQDDQGLIINECAADNFEHIQASTDSKDDRLALWAHLTSEHAGIYGLKSSLSQLIEEHESEHAGPGTIRNHPRESRKARLLKISKVLLELETEDEESWGDQDE